MLKFYSTHKRSEALPFGLLSVSTVDVTLAFDESTTPALVRPDASLRTMDRNRRNIANWFWTSENFAIDFIFDPNNFLFFFFSLLFSIIWFCRAFASWLVRTHWTLAHDLPSKHWVFGIYIFQLKFSKWIEMALNIDRKWSPRAGAVWCDVRVRLRVRWRLLFESRTNFNHE